VCPRIQKWIDDTGWRTYELSNALSLVIPAEDAELTPLLRLGAGAFAGIMGMSATYPMDMVRGRLTVQVLSLLTPIHFIFLYL
jgi:hypothetical protein